MNLPARFYKHRRALMFIILVLALAGLLSVFAMPVALFPNVAFPRIRVDISAGSRPANAMAVAITTPVAEAVRQVPGVRNVESITSRGDAEITVDFNWGWDMNRALQDVNAAMGQVLPSLPPDTQIQSMRMMPTNDEPVMAYSVRSKTLTQTQLYDLAQYQLLPLISGVQGVANVQVQGRGAAELHVNVDPAKLRAYHLTMADVVNTVTQSANIQALGRLTDHYKLFLLLANNQPSSVSALRDLLVRAGPGGGVQVGDVATVTQSMAPQWVRTTANGRPAILMQIFQQPDADSLAIVDAVKARVAAYQSQMPKDVKIAMWYDQAVLVRQSAASVRDAILIGIGLAALVLFVFLRNVRVIVIALLVVPGTLAITTLLLMVLGMSFNMMTLGGMAAAVGLLIDDVVVMTEHIMRRVVGNTALPLRERIIAAVHEFMHPQTGSSLATIVIFLPLAFLGGVTGAFFKALALTMASALIISYLLAIIATPVLAQWLINERTAVEHAPTRLWQGFMAFYERVLRGLLKRPALLLIGVIPLIVVGFFAFKTVGTGFLPKMDQGGFVLDYVAEPGTSLAETNRELERIGAILAANPYVSNWSRRTGYQLGGGLTESNIGDFFVRLKNGKRPSTETVMNDILAKATPQVPGLDLDVAQLLEDMIGDLTAAPSPIVVKLFSDNVQQLNAAANKVAAQLGHVPGVVSIVNGIIPAGNALEVHVDDTRAALLGLNPTSVINQVNDAVGGAIAAQMPIGPKMVPVRVWVPPHDRAEIQQLEALPITDGNGNVIPLSRVATITRQHGQPEIDHENLKRDLEVTAGISGVNLGKTMQKVKKILTQRDELPPGMYYELGGLYHDQQVALRGMTMVLIAAFVLVFALLLFLYRSFLAAVAILIQPLLTLCAIFIGLWITGTELNISSMMGMTMIVGIVTELAIFFFSELAETADQTGSEHPLSLHDRLLAAGRGRTRAILMSMFAMVLTLLPLALAISRGAQMQRPLAIAIIAGMLVAPPLVLLVMPTLYHVFLRGRNPVTSRPDDSPNRAALSQQGA